MQGITEGMTVGVVIVLVGTVHFLGLGDEVATGGLLMRQAEVSFSFILRDTSGSRKQASVSSTLAAPLCRKIKNGRRLLPRANGHYLMETEFP